MGAKGGRKGKKNTPCQNFRLIPFLPPEQNFRLSPYSKHFAKMKSKVIKFVSGRIEDNFSFFMFSFLTIFSKAFFPGVFIPNQ